jgi:hypothetical protein
MPTKKIEAINIFLGALLCTKISSAKLYIIGARTNKEMFPAAYRK